MTYTSQGLIQATDYNTFVTAAANSINGIGNTYGQTVTSAATQGGTVTATQWADLVNKLSNYGAHTNVTVTARTAPVTGNTISILANVQTDLNNVYGNRFNAATQGATFTGWTGTNSKTAATGAGTWTITITNTVTFANSTAATNFFQAGGLVQIRSSKTATGATGDPPWNALATSTGNVFISTGNATVASQTIVGTSYTGVTRIGGSGTPSPNLTGNGWNNLVAGAAATNVFQINSPTAPYTADFIRYSLAKDATSAVLTITALWNGADGDPISGGTAASGATPGTAPCTIVTAIYPESTNISNTWGSISIAATTV